MLLIIKVEWVDFRNGEMLSASRVFENNFFNGTREYVKEQFYKVLREILNYVRERNGVLYRMAFDGVCFSCFASDRFNEKENEYTLENIYRYARV